jgi:hypothetical protein
VSHWHLPKYNSVANVEEKKPRKFMNSNNDIVKEKLRASSMAFSLPSCNLSANDVDFSGAGELGEQVC